MAKKKIRLTPCGGIKLYCSTICLETAQAVRKCQESKCPLYRFRRGNNPNRLKRYKTTTHPRKARSGKFSSVYNGKKRVNIKGLKKGGKIYVEMPKEAVLVISQQTKKRGKK